MQQILIGIVLGCIIFYAIIYLLRVVLGPGKFTDNFTEKWAWNIFQPDAVNLDICKEAGVINATNCDGVCPTQNLATDCPAAGYRRPYALTNDDLQLLSGNSGDHDEITYLEIYNNSLTKATSLDTTTLKGLDFFNMLMNIDNLTSNIIPSGTDLSTCTKCKGYLDGLLGITLTNAQASNLLSVCTMSGTQLAEESSGVLSTLSPNGTSDTVGQMLMSEKLTFDVMSTKLLASLGAPSNE